MTFLKSRISSRIIFSAMGPQFGTRLQEVKRRGVDVFIAMDTSRSMLAEDAAETRVALARYLRRSGYEVLEATDGQEALEIAARCEQPLDALITDIIMPGLDGRDLLRGLRRDGPYMHLPAVVVSGGVGEENVLSEHIRGEVDASLVTFLAKPLNYEELGRLLCRLLN